MDSVTLYWDTTPDFPNHINTLLAFNRKNPARIHAPFVQAKFGNFGYFGCGRG